LYDDDGETYDYENGQYSWREIIVERSGNKWQGTISNAEEGKPNSIEAVSWKFMTQ